MTAIWRNDGDGWHLLAPSGFPAEDDLHTLVADAPHILPLAGDPQLVVLGREVRLGSGSADLVAVEPNGRLVIIEVKLAKNAEARRAVVAQALTYAAYLYDTDPQLLEQDTLARHLRQRDYGTIAAAVASNDQTGAFDDESFVEELAESLRHGRFRLVFVLDEAPMELIRLVGYLEAVTDQLLIDLVTVGAYRIGGSDVLVPQRVDAERVSAPSDRAGPPSRTGARYVEGAEALEVLDEFEALTATAPEADQAGLHRLCKWLKYLASEGLIYIDYGKGMGLGLLPHVPGEKVSMVDMSSGNGRYLVLKRGPFVRNAPQALAKVERLIGGTLGRSRNTWDTSNKFLAVLTEAFREAAGRTSAAESDRE